MPPRAASSSRAWQIACTGSYWQVKVTPNVATTPIVFSSTRRSTSAGVNKKRSGSIGTSQLDVEIAGELVPTNLHRPADQVGAVRRLASRPPPSRHRHFRARPANIAASLEPVVEQPMVLAAAGEFHKSANMWTARASISAVWGYSSLSTIFLSRHSSIRRWTSGSTQVWQKVARFIRVAVEHQLVVHDRIGLLRRMRIQRKAILGGHERPAARAVDVVDQPRTNRIFGMQRHESLSCMSWLVLIAEKQFIRLKPGP